MAVPESLIWQIEPHTVAKHYLLRQYLAAWMPIVSRSFGSFLYVDGFAGPGIYEGGEPGSPIIALNVATKHEGIPQSAQIGFRFIEKNDDRADELLRQIDLIDGASRFNIKVKKGDFAGRVFESIDEFTNECRRPVIPKLVTIDPFGFSGIPFETVSRILQQPNCEVFITFMADSINRFLDHPEGEIRAHIDEAFGLDVVTEKILESGNTDRITIIQKMYADQLSTAAKFVRAFSMHNCDDRLQYILFFATNHPLGFARMKEAMWKLDRTGQFKFSDRTDPEQCVLFTETEAAESILADHLLNRFRGQIVNSDTVMKHTSEKTAFIEKHCRAALKSLEEAGQIDVRPIKNDGKKRRCGTFAPGTTIRFSC